VRVPARPPVFLMLSTGLAEGGRVTRGNNSARLDASLIDSILALSDEVATAEGRVPKPLPAIRAE
ncbi:MAG TPA: hypothetical protein VHJ58_19575, partial [Vicinamibacterales bacterium]|nr:hypothetical protein [Vicinamibacterales bacterium]